MYRSTFSLIFFLALFVSVPVFSQPTPEAMRERYNSTRTEILSLLELRDEQVSVVGQILDDGFDKRLSLMESRSSSTGFSGMREKIGAIEKETERKLKEVLDERQMKAYTKYVEENRRNRRGRREPPGNRDRIN